jgi:folate-dependent phosphoribosylglycinamide formyltransferase PurN
MVVQAAVPVLADDSEDRLAARVLLAEHAIYPAAVRWFLEGRLRVEGQRVIGRDLERQEGVRGVLFSPDPER